jgi:hypothetical protein
LLFLLLSRVSRFQVFETKIGIKEPPVPVTPKTLKEQLTGVVGMKERTWAKESMVGYLGAQPNVFKTFENHGYISEPGI